MRVEATLSEVRGKALLAVAEELGMSPPQVLDEALTLWLEVVEASKRGLRLVLKDPGAVHPDRGLATPAMVRLDGWHHHAECAWSPEAQRRLAEHLDQPGAPTEALRRLMAGEDVEGIESLETQGIGG